VQGTVNEAPSTPVDNPVDELWTVLHSLWTERWKVVDKAVGDTPGSLAAPPLTSQNVPAHGVDGKRRRIRTGQELP
jgi:hypothetical protein